MDTYVLGFSVGHLCVVDLLLPGAVLRRPVVLAVVAEATVEHPRSDHIPFRVVLGQTTAPAPALALLRLLTGRAVVSMVSFRVLRSDR